jgi:glycerol-3-phosphate dehydrogenase
LKDVIEGLRPPTMRLIRGSHIVVPNLFDHDNAYIFQNIDRRIVFAIPYERDFTLIGTTDDEFDGDLDTVSISAEEVDYLCTAMNRFFTQKIFRDDVVWSFAGVRPLLGGGRDQAEEVTRDYRLDLQKTVTGSTALSVLGGKITTYRKLAEQAMTKLGTVLDIPTESWTVNTPLPGGNIKDANVAVFTDSVAQNYPWLQRDLLNRYVSAYGTRISVLLDGVSGMDDMGEIFSAGLFECEVRYLVKHEWARTADDILWRRTKLGLHANAATGALLQNWLEANASE